MKALQVIRGREFQILQVETPVPGPGEVRVRVDAVTICAQWDLHLRRNEPMFAGREFWLPYTVGQPGHEASGVVDAVGPHVTTVAAGDRVSVWRDPGHEILGAYAQFLVRPEEEVIQVPEDLPAEATASVELAMCVACSVLRMVEMGVIRGHRLGVMGLGPAGLIAVQMLRAEGAAEVFGIDPVESRRTLAIRLGATQCFDPKDAKTAIGVGPDRVLDSAIDCVGAKTTVEFLLDRVFDTVQLFGVQREDYTFKPSHYLGVRLSGYTPHRREAAEYAVSLLRSKQLDLGALVSHEFPLEEYDKAIDLLETSAAVKVALRPWAEGA